MTFSARRFTAATIYRQANGATDVFAVDLDRDGDTDVLSAAEHDDAVRWYENHQENLIGE